MLPGTGYRLKTYPRRLSHRLLFTCASKQLIKNTIYGRDSDSSSTSIDMLPWCKQHPEHTMLNNFSIANKTIYLEI